MAPSNTIRRNNLPDDIPLVPKPTQRRLNSRQQQDYQNHRQTILEWLYTNGKNPDRGEGYSHSSLKNTAYRLDQFYRWRWEQSGYRTNITSDDGDAYLDYLKGTDTTDANKRKVLSALKRLFKWKRYTQGTEAWEPEITFSSRSNSSQPRDYLTKEERTKIREAALEHGSVPSYNDLTPAERNRWKTYLAQRFGKPKSAVTPTDWEKANSWKIPSLVWTSLDTGLRPVEVERATIRWIDIQNGMLRIPKEESSKNRENWYVGLTERTAKALRRWLKERENYEMYRETESLWLTREKNPLSVTIAQISSRTSL